MRNPLIRYQTTLSAILLLFCLPSLAWSQPGTASTQQELNQLMRRVQQLQAEIQSNEDHSGRDRVKQLGTATEAAPVPLRPKAVMQIRMYDLSDMFVVSPSYPAPYGELVQNTGTGVSTRPGFAAGNGLGGGGLGGGGIGGGGFGGGQMGGGGGGVFSIPSNTFGAFPEPTASPQGGGSHPNSVSMSSAQISLERLVQMIKKTVSPTRWGNSDEDAKLEVLANTLLITAPTEMHQQIADLLDLFREHWGKRRTISIQSFWIRGSQVDAHQLLDDETQRELGAGVILKEKWKTFLETAQAENRIVFSATLTGHNNQTLHTKSGRQSYRTLDGEYLASAKTQLDDEGNVSAESTRIVGFRPIRTTVYEGPTIQVTPLATRGGNYVILDLHALYSKTPEDSNQQPPKLTILNEDGTNPELELDAGMKVAGQFKSTVRCPKEEIVLAGAMTFDTAQPTDHPNLLIFVKATVHTIEEDESDWNLTKKEK